MKDYIMDLQKFIEGNAEATRTVNLYNRGYVTFEECNREIAKLYHDSAFYWIVYCKEDRRGAKWREYSGNAWSHREAEAHAAELNEENRLSVRGHKIIFQVRPIAKWVYDERSKTA